MASQVDYIIVGAYALAYHGVPQLTGVIDILVRPDPDNARRILSALSDFGFGSLPLTETDFTTHDTIIQLGVPPVRIDFLTTITGVSWDEADSEKIEGTYSEYTHWIPNVIPIKRKGAQCAPCIY